MGSNKIQSFDVPRKKQEIIRWKEAKRLELRNIYLRELQNPVRHEMITDDAIQRFATLRHTNEYNIKLTPRSSIYGLFIPLGIMVAFTLWIKKRRDQQEHQYRTGQISYADRDMRFC